MLPLVTLDIGVPIYRVSNGRTQTEQVRYIDEHGLAETFFSQGEEDAEVQVAQHSILTTLAHRGRQSSILPIIDKLRSDRRQTDHLLITRTGVVVNGNRRLAGLRELYGEDPNLFAAFRTITALVLDEGITEQQICLIEFRLQVAPETKLPYKWVDELLSLRRLLQQDADYETVIRAMGGRTNRDDIRARLAVLDESQIYLREHLGRPHDFAALENLEQHFTNLAERLRRRSEPEKAAARAIAYGIAAVRERVGSRIHDLRDAFGRHLDGVACRLAARGCTAAVDAPKQGGLFGEDGDGYLDAKETALMGVASFVRGGGEDAAREIGEAVIEVLDEIRDEAGDEAAGNQALQKVRRAHTSLTEADLGRAAEPTYAEIRRQLEGVQRLAGDLLHRLEELER